MKHSLLAHLLLEHSPTEHSNSEQFPSEEGAVHLPSGHSPPGHSPRNVVEEQNNNNAAAKSLLATIGRLHAQEEKKGAVQAEPVAAACQEAAPTIRTPSRMRQEMLGASIAAVVRLLPPDQRLRELASILADRKQPRLELTRHRPPLLGPTPSPRARQALPRLPCASLPICSLARSRRSSD